MLKSNKSPRTLWSSLRRFFSALILLYILMWSPLGFYFVKYYYFSDDIYADDNISAELKTAGLELRYPVDVVPSDCILDELGYHFFKCNNIASLSKKLLESGQTRMIVASSHVPEIVAESDSKLGNRILLTLEGSKLKYDVIDRGSYDKLYPISFTCIVTSKSKPNIFTIYIVKEICGYKGNFIYRIVGMGSDYDYPYNPTGDSVLPLRVTSWVDYSQDKVTNGKLQ